MFRQGIMSLPFSRKVRQVISIAAALTIALALPVSVSLGFTEKERHSPPRLDVKRLLRAYKPHRKGKEITVSPLTWSADGRHAFYTVVERDSPQLGDEWN